MVKKTILLLLIFGLLLSLCACGNKPAEDPTNTPTDVPTTPAEIATDEPAIEATTEGNIGIETDEDLLTVKITFPASFFEGEDMAAFDADAYAEEQGFLSAKMNEDGSMTATMTKRKHKELLEETAASLNSSFASMVNSEDTPYIKDISHNDDFSIVTMTVDRASYENSFDFTPFVIYISTSLYQSLIDMECHVEIQIADAATNEVFKTIVYPDVLNS